MLALVVGLALAITLAAWWIQSRSVPQPGATTAPPVGPLARETPSVLPPRWDITPATVHLPLSSVGATRTPDSDASAPQRELLGALAPYNKGDYQAAIPALEAFVQRYPDAADALLYLGVSDLMAGRPAEALAPLERAADLKTPAGRREVDWFLAAAEQRSGRLEASRGRLERLCRAPGAYQASACAARDALR